MLQIQPVSELRNYNKVLEKVKKNSPVFLTKNGYGKFALVDIEEYDEFTTVLDLINKLKKAEGSKHYNFDDIKGELFS
ncbi:type II toxin-antitoxin system prevent-host-death family antitoxin [Lactobacillus crispatus]|uniref:type II toxin-antitoxin system prevent-host-death family antitoxin n=1 Tax=Lactobacillus crispatus TaxID=47770 RepID=UPI0022E7BFAD|nr:type II toxin-antitoxin system prevent-host-death family antitoxin [Lactobacillus crispatus]